MGTVSGATSSEVEAAVPDVFRNNDIPGALTREYKENERTKSEKKKRKETRTLHRLGLDLCSYFVP